MTIPTDHLRACTDHHVVAPPLEGGCPACQTGVEAQPAAVRNEKFTTLDMRWAIEGETMVKLLPLLEHDAAEQGIGPVYVSVAEISLNDVRSAAGYTDQERWFNVAVAETGENTRTIVKHESDALEAIETIEEENHYLEPADTPEQEQLNPEAWYGVVDPYCDVEYERVDEKTLRFHIANFPSDSAYKKARREIGQIAKSCNFTVKTVEAGGRWEDGIVDVSVP